MTAYDLNLRKVSYMKKCFVLAICVSILTSCATLTTIDDVPIAPEVIRSGHAYIWGIPGKRRVTFDRLDNNDFEFALHEFPESPAQKGEDWCWAYCASQVLRYNGTETSPEKLVNELRARRKGKTLRGDAGTVVDIIRPLMGSGRFVGVYTANVAWLAQDISYDSPVILALAPEREGENGHAVVLVGLRFSFVANQAIAAEFTLYDPKDGQIVTVDASDIAARIKWAIHFRDFRRF